MGRNIRDCATNRAPPQNGAQESRPTPVASGQGLPCQGRTRLKTRAPTRKLRFATWNIGTLTGRARELADVLFRRRVAVAFLQETRWKGSRSRSIGNGYKLIYTGAAGGENGVAVVLSEEFRDKVLEVKRYSDRLMDVWVLIEGVTTHLISAYAPQAGCGDTEKTAFWNQLGLVLRDIPLSQGIVLGGDLNGHVGGRCEEFVRVHGGYGNRIERTASKRWRGSVRRIVSATIYNLSCFTHGCSTGWGSGVLGNEALTGGAWLAALPCLVALPAAPFFAVLADARGRKAGALCICISFIISWSLAAWCGPRGVWAARVAAGAGGAGALSLAPLYCAEIAPRTRGLAAMPSLACSCGILFAYAAGGVLSAHALSLSMAVPPVVLLMSLIWLPETPSFLISVGRIQDAAKIICWFDGSDFREDLTDVIEQQEVKIRTSDCYGRREPLRRQDSDTFQPMLKRSSGLDSNSDKKNEQSACRELFRHRRSRRALISCLVVLSAAAGSGAGAVNSFAAAVLRHSTHSVPHLNLTAYNFTIYNGTVPRRLFDSSEAGSILCGTALVLGAAVATASVDKLGRKMLLLWSCSGITCCLAILGVYCDPNLHIHTWYSHRLWPYRRTHNFKDKGLQIAENITIPEWKVPEIPEWKNCSDGKLENDSYGGEWKVENVTDGPQYTDEETLWAPVALMSVVLFLYNIGLGSVPYVLISEWFTMNVRSLASSLLISWMWFSSFLIIRYYGSLAVSVGLHGTYYICAAITLLGSLYIFFIIPETKGKSQEQIDEDLDGPLVVLTRRRKNEER